MLLHCLSASRCQDVVYYFGEIISWTHVKGQRSLNNYGRGGFIKERFISECRVMLVFIFVCFLPKIIVG